MGPTQSSGWGQAKGEILRIELPQPLIKYEFGPADRRSLELKINCEITYFSDGSGRLRKRYLMDNEEKNESAVTIIEDIIETEEKDKLDANLNKQRVTK